jgi:uncharacterized SAM-binding protein YcdF (DUF218 family)
LPLRRSDKAVRDGQRSPLRRRLRIRRLALAAALLFLIWLAAGIAIDTYGQPERAQAADVIVVLGSQVYPGGVPGPALTRRADHAAALYRRGLAPAVLCSGGVGANPPSEASVACARVAADGVPDGALILEESSRSTEENALNSAAVMRAHGWTRAILVTDAFNVYRAEALFRANGVAVYPSPAQVTAGPMSPLESVPRSMREAVALVWYWGKGPLGIQATDFP